VHNMSLRDRIRARLLACFTSEIVAVSKATAEVMARNMWVKRARIKVVVNGVAVSEQEREAQGGSRRPRWLIDGVDSRIVRRDAECHLAVPPLASRVGSATAFRIKCGIPADARVIGTVGRLAHVKGTDRLIAAFAAIPQQLSSCQVAQLLSDNPEISPPSATQQPSNLTTYLLLVGDGPERVNLERQARELGVADRVIFAGYQADPAPCLAAMDVFVLPSRSEGVSVALLEAMAAGIPVAVTDVGANREVIEEGQCGVILPEDERQWPEIVAAMLMGPEANALKARAARERVRTHYSLETTLDGYESLYL
jgi:glycosyltransferase involved in cell wall biosynthesis